MIDGFQRVLDQIRAIADTEAEKGRLFERLMRTFFQQDPLYRQRFSKVWLWSEWAATRSDFDSGDSGIDLVAEEREGGFCAIQCKCHAPGTKIAAGAIDSFISYSSREVFTARIFVDTGDDWGRIARKKITGLKPECQVLRFGDLASRPFDWPDLVKNRPEDLAHRGKPFRLRPHQQLAFDEVLNGFENSDRGKLIMACGTGKTFTALRIAETLAGEGGRVLYLLPSISLFQQSMREWAEQREIAHRYIGICSDVSAGKTEEDVSLLELEIPVTTDPAKIGESLRRDASGSMIVVFCTYHSLGLVEQAQNEGAPPFDLIVCDEAHRTTGVDRPGDQTSPFVLVHDAGRVRAAKRLYMTATPRLYTQGAKTTAAQHSVEVFSMDDEDTYGPEFHRLPFSRAIDQDLLSDYKVAIFALSEGHVSNTLQAHLTSAGGTIDLSEAAKIVGCWRVLQNPENSPSVETRNQPPIRRAIAFTGKIATSKLLEKHWGGMIEQAVAQLSAEDGASALRCEVRHVDGTHHALERKERIDWLKGSSEGACRILSNARCLSEGVNVPALDAVIFMTERRSTVDIVQAVGRAMRKTDDKKYGYIVLPVAIPPDRDPAAALDSGDEFEAVWSVLRALRSHDDRFDAEINKIDLNNTPTDRIIFNLQGVDGVPSQSTPELPFPPLDLPPDAIYARIVEKCGDRKYWESWAKDVADIFSRLVTRIGGLLADKGNEALSEWFEAFHGELKQSINDSITSAAAVDMMAQHVLTRPVFEALFEGYDFAGGNPVARALDALRRDFGEFGLENETRDLEGFYESVRLRARGLDNAAARQRVLMELYEKFFATAMKKDAERLGIVYTPTEIVDFILASADHATRSEFGRGLSEEGVHVLDPFTGTGIFLVRLLQSQLIHNADLERKYREELHANELVLLAYYIAAIHIEEAYRGRIGEAGDYEPFGGIVLTDTFNLHTGRSGFPKDWLPGNSERAERQQKLPIQVIVGNPPWSTGQRSAADDNPNVDYPEIERRVAQTYADRSTATLKSSLYDTYKMAIRWASDRIGDQGVIAFVTNGSWIDGNVDSGVRACLAEEFTSIYVLNLRGNQRTQGERSRREGGKVFGQGSRAPVAVTILVKNPHAAYERCRILYRDIGDYLARQDKLKMLRDWDSIAGIEDWEEIRPDRHHDWVGQRDEAFHALFPLGSKEAKARKTDDTVFQLFSNGYKSGRDAYVYNFSRRECADNASKMVNEYRAALTVRETNPAYTIDAVVKSHSSSLRWDDKLKRQARRKTAADYSENHIRSVAYRPFVKQFLYADPIFAQREALTGELFPSPVERNRAICVPGIGSTKPFSALVVDTMPDLELISKGQCFARYRFAQSNRQQSLPGLELPPERIDNISDTALRAFRVRYGDNQITKDAIFDYIYGVLHAPSYRDRFANDLAKGLPRIPFAADFHAFAEAGRRLTELHLAYETCDEYPLSIECLLPNDPKPEHFRIGARKMHFVDDDKSALAINEHIRLAKIPPEAHEYSVNGRTPLEWFIDRYRITQDKQSGIVNDPNGWFEDPRDLIAAFRRIVHLSVQTFTVVNNLPNPFPDPEPNGEQQ